MKNKTAYIAHPISGDQKGNTQKVLDLVGDINSDPSNNYNAVAPYIVDCLTLDDKNPLHRSGSIDRNITYLRSGIVDELWLYGPHISLGMMDEIRLCEGLGIKIVAMSPGTIKQWDNRANK